MNRPTRLCLAVVASWFAGPGGRGQLVISEFLASNESGLRDEINEKQDWIEIENTSGATVSLSGWHLTDDHARLRKWPFPAWTLGAGKRLVVFASDRDRRPAQAVPGQDNTGTAVQPRLAANFKVSSSAGGHLALTRDSAGGAVEVVSAYAGYPRQVPDVSWGRYLASTPLVAADTPARALVPAAANGGDALGASWHGGAEPFDDAGWTAGRQGAGMSGSVAPVAAASLKLRLNADTAETLTADASGAGHDGTNPGGATGYVPEAADTAASPLLRRGALQFVAAAAATSSSQVVVPAHDDLNAAAGTILFWIKSGPTAAAMGGTEGAMVWDRRNTTSGTVLVLNAASGANAGRLFSRPAGGTTLFSTVRIDDNQWHHVAFVYNQAAGGTDAFYIDGRPAGAAAHANAWSWPAAQPVELGRSHDTRWQKFNGLLDEVRFYDSALPADQISQVFNGADEAVDRRDLALDLSAALPGQAGAFIRIPFIVENPAAYQTLRFSIRATDGVVARLNGAPVDAFNAPPTPAWDSLATGTALAGRSRVLELPPASLATGRNVLALHALNTSADDPNLLALARLDGVALDPAGTYLLTATPGAANTGQRTSVGPFIAEVTYNGSLDLPPRPAGGPGSPDLAIRARITPGLRPLAATDPVHLAFRVMYEPETRLTMIPAADGFHTAAIPTTGLGAGQLLRWRIIATDSAGIEGTAPAFLRPAHSDQYYGTVAQDAVSTQLPVYHVFVPGPYAFNNTHVIDRDNAGGRGSLFFDGELYDNIFFRIKGDTTRTLRKRSHRVDFNGEHQFRWAAGRKRLRELALNAEYVDPACSRQMMSLWLHRESGTGGPEHFPVRCQINGGFWQLAFHTETQDFELLDAMGLDPNGAMYASVGEMSGAAGEKQTRVTENSADMAAFVAAITASNLATRKNHVFDRIDIPAVVNYLAVARIMQEGDDVWANMVIHRDSDGTGEWRIIPFDANLSWGQLYWEDFPSGNSVIHAANDRNKSHPLYGNQACSTLDYATGRYNRFYNAIISVPETRAMLLRRMRSLMDAYLQPPGTEAPVLEAMIDAHAARILPEVELDRAQWGRPSNGGPYGFGNQPFATAIAQMKSLFIGPRRTHLFTTHTSAANVGIANAKSAGLPAEPQPADCAITIAGYDATPAGSATQDEEYVQLDNPNAYAADLSGWRLTGGVRFTFKGGTVIPPRGSLYVSPRQAAFRSRTASPKGAEGRFVVGPSQGRLSARGEFIELQNAAGGLVASATTPSTPTAAQRFLRVTELSYHPANPTAAERAAISSVVTADFEFIELLNTGSDPLDLGGARFTKGVDFTFPAGASLAPGARLLVAANPPAFQLRHGTDAAVVGPYLGSLDNAGEDLEIVDGSGEVVLDFAYDDSWFPPTDGTGRTLVVREAAPSHDGYGRPAHWAISGSPDGSPGTGDETFASHYRGWRWDHFTEGEVSLPDGSENTALAGLAADADADGLNNLGEYAFGRDPRTADGSPIVTTGLVTIGPADFATVTFQRRRQALDLAYDVQFSADLVTWTSGAEPLGPPADLGGGVEQVAFRATTPAGPGPHFARAVARAR